MSSSAPPAGTRAARRAARVRLASRARDWAFSTVTASNTIVFARPHLRQATEIGRDHRGDLRIPSGGVAVGEQDEGRPCPGNLDRAVHDPV